MTLEEKKKIATEVYRNTDKPIKEIAIEFDLSYNIFTKHLSNVNAYNRNVVQMSAIKSRNKKLLKEIPVEKVNRVLTLGQFGDYSLNEIKDDVGLPISKIELILKEKGGKIGV